VCVLSAAHWDVDVVERPASSRWLLSRAGICTLPTVKWGNLEDRKVIKVRRIQACTACAVDKLEKHDITGTFH
jgi:hypothetical protein